ncbi:hypothetical protein [Kitasatospora sp. NPDC094016]|uniref:hypothetical protein n=1 Tax=Kitasatospora sp. NPDC094016 TaxID=3154986 RepID=UPI003327A548
MPDWTRMQPADFDADVAPPLFTAPAADRPVPAVADDFGTEALFGASVPPRPAAAPPKPRPTPTPDNPLF